MIVTSRPIDRIPGWTPWLIAIAGFALDVAAFWPGQMSFDSAYTWWQARGGTMTNIAPPLLIYFWRACDLVLDGPGLVFAWHLALFWSGLALVSSALRMSPIRALGITLIVAFAPMPWLLRSHVWTDVGLFSALLFATGALARAEVSRNRAWLWVALPVLCYAIAIRYNALPAVVPFVAWMMRLAFGPAASIRRVAVATIVSCAALSVLAGSVSASVQRRVPLWPASAQWDLAAISIATGEMLLPPFMIGPDLDVDELAAAFRDWSMIPMLQNTQHGMRDPFMGAFTPDQLAELRRAWLDAVRAHPNAWLAHHLRQARALLGTHDPSWPRELIYVDDEVPYGDNPPVARNATPLHKMLFGAAARLSRTAWLAGWPYLAIGLVALPFAWRRRRELAGACALIVLASAWLYFVPLVVLVPAELRYLGWCAVASLLAAGLAGIAPSSQRMPARLQSSPIRTSR